MSPSLRKCYKAIWEGGGGGAGECYLSDKNPNDWFLGGVRSLLLRYDLTDSEKVNELFLTRVCGTTQFSF